MVLAYGGKASTGIVLPLLTVGDILAIVYYRKDANWKALRQLFPPMAVGVVIGVFVGDKLDEQIFKQVMGVIILFSGIMMVFKDKIFGDKIPEHKGFAILMGLGAGFTTMIGNLAGAFTNLYFLAMRFPKKEFIGTAAWLFFFSNLFKLPFHIWVWETVSPTTLAENMYHVPFVIAGFMIGLKLIGYFSNQLFEKYIIVMTILGALLIFLR